MSYWPEARKRQPRQSSVGLSRVPRNWMRIRKGGCLRRRRWRPGLWRGTGWNVDDEFIEREHDTAEDADHRGGANARNTCGGNFVAEKACPPSPPARRGLETAHDRRDGISCPAFD